MLVNCLRFWKTFCIPYRYRSEATRKLCTRSVRSDAYKIERARVSPSVGEHPYIPRKVLIVFKSSHKTVEVRVATFTVRINLHILLSSHLECIADVVNKYQILLESKAFSVFSQFIKAGKLYRYRIAEFSCSGAVLGNSRSVDKKSQQNIGTVNVMWGI